VLLRKAQLAALCGVTTRTVNRWCADDPSFPKPIWLGPKTQRWRLEEVERWLSSRPTGRQAGKGVRPCPA
jgi:predicted DNA-binding transcriptional regulator AlpA